MIRSLMISRFALVALAVAAMTSCSKNDDEDDIIAPPTNPNETILSGTLSANKTLTADKTWTLKGYVYVPNGVTLTIEAGTTIKSDKTEKGALCIERGGKIQANGTVDKPIVMTSGQDAGARNPGDWGGLIILGNAPTNRTSTPVIEGGLDRVYGGTNANDNSGTLKYVRIEYAGIAAFPGSEINGLTLGGVGSGTTIENVQIVYGNDDAYEFFGGNVNAKYLVAYGTADDDFDFDFGYTGKIQFAVALRDPSFVDNGDAGNGIEADNDGSGTAATPYTRPVLSNFTFVGPNNATGTAANHNFGNRWRRAVRFVLRNSILMGWQKGGFSIESDGTANDYSAAGGTSEFKNNLVHAVADPYRVSGLTTATLTAAAIRTKAESEGCKTYANAADIKLTSPFALTAPNLLPATGSDALAGASFTGLDAFFATTTYVGAFGTTNWLASWTRFPAKGQ
jgi:hypothetical protein